MKKNLLILIFLLFLSGFNHPNDLAAWVVLEGSSLTVKGSTNINTFHCDITNYAMPDTLSCLIKNIKGQSLTMNGRLNLNIEAFDCHNKMMTNDLRKTLKSNSFPNLTIRFLSINSFPNFEHPVAISGKIEIGLAGVTKQFDINYVFTLDKFQHVNLVGGRLINFSDFNLIPPVKLGGVIKANDALDVAFKLNLKPIA